VEKVIYQSKNNDPLKEGYGKKGGKGKYEDKKGHALIILCLSHRLFGRLFNTKRFKNSINEF